MPSVKVKKADGTFATVPLEQLKSSKKTVPAQGSKNQSKMKVGSAQPPHLITAPASVPALPTGKLSSADFTSPLEENTDSLSLQVATQKSFANHHVSDVLAALSFSVPPDYENRLRTVVQLCIKQVRTDDQTREVSHRSLKEGGLGLSEKQVEELLHKCREALKKMHPEYAVELPATTSPVNPFKHAASNTSLKTTVAETQGKMVSGSAALPSSLDRSIKEPPFDAVTKILETGTAVRRPVMKDVVFKPTTLGPIEELRSITLTDIRRLAPGVKDAFARFGQKFVNARNESVILFFEARDAYRKGVLFEEYTSILLRSLSQKKTLAELLSKAQDWTYEEVKELAETEKRLAL